MTDKLGIIIYLKYRIKLLEQLNASYRKRWVKHNTKRLSEIEGTEKIYEFVL